MIEHISVIYQRPNKHGDIDAVSQAHTAESERLNEEIILLISFLVIYIFFEFRSVDGVASTSD